MIPKRFVSAVLVALLLIAGVVAGSVPSSRAATLGPASNVAVYLPLVIKPAAAAAGLANGDFESGRTGWVEYSSRNAYPLIGDAFLTGVTPRSGRYMVWLGGAKNEIASIAQQVTVSSEAPYLAYWHWIASADACGYDTANIGVNGATVASYDLCADAATEGWVKRVTDLSAYAGQSVTLQIMAINDFSRISNLFIDDVAFQAAPGLAEASAPLAVPQPKDAAPATPDQNALPKAGHE